MSVHPATNDQPLQSGQDSQIKTPPRPARPQRTMTANPELVELPPAMSLSTLFILLVGTVLGAFAAVMVLPTWAPALSTSLLGDEPKA
jgi:hypothetical protein